VRRENYLSNRNAAIEAARVARASGKYKIAWKLRYDTDATFKARILQANRERRKNSGARMKAKIAKRKNEIANPAAKIARNLRVRMRKTLLGISKSASTISLLGCSAAEFARHLESHFKPGMSWANYGYFGWHIDHAIPCAAFNLTDPIQQKACFHFTNMRPEWRFENQSKGKRLLLDVLTKADVRLLAIAREQIGGAA
jgi:hypothetical protein